MRRPRSQNVGHIGPVGAKCSNASRAAGFFFRDGKEPSLLEFCSVRVLTSASVSSDLKALYKSVIIIIIIIIIIIKVRVRFGSSSSQL